MRTDSEATAQRDKAERFAALHVKGDPVILFNVWDAGSARAVADAGAKALATGSWSVAAANGYDDGEKIPLATVVSVVERICAVSDLPVTLDFESGYARGGAELEENVERMIAAGAIGINFEDQEIGSGSIFPLDEQAARIQNVRAGATRAGIPLFINARTDLFLKNPPTAHSALMNEAIARADAYASAGASGLFVPGLRDEALIGRICERSPIPVNVMFLPELPDTARLAQLGVARISWGPRPYRQLMGALVEAAKLALKKQ